MIAKTPAIPLACYPYSTTSRIVHWLTRHHGKVSALLKGALRSKSPFMGEYELFSTSELLYFTKHAEALHTAKECSMLHSRHSFRTDWRAAQAASYISALFNKTTPAESPLPGCFELLEELLDFAEDLGNMPQFLYWAELRFCDYHGHSPKLDACVYCGIGKPLLFSASAGGTVCQRCAQGKRIPFIESPPDVLDHLRAWQKQEHPEKPKGDILTDCQILTLDTMAEAFMFHHFDMPIEQRRSATYRIIP